MSNRRRPKRVIALNPVPPPRPRLPLELQHIEWSDEPAPDFPEHLLWWIVQQRSTARRLNAWRCEQCGIPFIAYDRHPGTTPMLVSHRGFAEALGDTTETCVGLCESVFYHPAPIVRAAVDLGQQSDLPPQPSHEWYRPSADELATSNRRTRDHVMQGGLLLRKARS